MSPADNSSPYDVLDISYLAAEADIKRHYRNKTLLLHPDKWLVKHENVDEVSCFAPHGRKANNQAFDAFNKVSSNHPIRAGPS
jgi:preprotein translocase subunit Sec63